MATIECRLCLRTYETGAPAQPGQDNSTFVCAECGVLNEGYPQDGRRNSPEAALRFRPDALAKKPGLLAQIKKLFGAP